MKVTVPVPTSRRCQRAVRALFWNTADAASLMVAIRTLG